MWLPRWSTGLAMTVLVGAMQADSRGSVVGRGSGDCSCLTVSSYREKQEDDDFAEDRFFKWFSVNFYATCMNSMCTCWLSCRRKSSSMRTEVTPPPLAP